ncbi:MAG: type I-E CRISPR-associated protein Cas5/CasD [Stellaceae bacterium]
MSAALRRHLLLRLDAPLMSFGAPIVDQHGRTGDIPLPSMITGLLANALGFRRTEGERLQRLQDRLVLAARWDRAGERLRDFQTAELKANDRGWTTRGRPEGRAGGAGTYAGKHIRYRWHQADGTMTVALRLEPAAEPPGLPEVAEALQWPARPLFIGRKPFLPAAPILAGFVETESVLDAVLAAPLAEGCAGGAYGVFWPEGEGERPDAERRLIEGRRNWLSGVHGGREVWYRAEEETPPSEGRAP